MCPVCPVSISVDRPDVPRPVAEGLEDESRTVAREMRQAIIAEAVRYRRGRSALGGKTPKSSLQVEDEATVRGRERGREVGPFAQNEIRLLRPRRAKRAKHV